MELGSKFKEIGKPTFFRFFLALSFLTWEYFYSYMGYRLDYFSFLGNYFNLGLGLVNWNNYFIRSSFMVLLWLIVAAVIFGIIWGIEFFSVASHNRKIKKNYKNVDKSSLEGLLKSQIAGSRDYFINQLVIVGSLAILAAGLFIFSDFIEGIRYGLVENMVLNLIENDVSVDFDSTMYQILGFGASFVFWYFYSGLVATIFNIGRDRQHETEIQDEHFAVAVQNVDIEEE